MAKNASVNYPNLVAVGDIGTCDDHFMSPPSHSSNS